jgi:serine/threonine-protein kinase
MHPERIGRYELKAELGRGGMATVYRAYDPSFEREVAIKILPREFLHDPRFLDRFTREAKTIAALEHTAIVSVYDFGEQDGQPYLVMRLMTGGSLADRLKQGPIPLLEAARIFSRLAPALDKAHGLGIIHRDLKPGNILFDADGDPYISDFGIAKLTEATASLTGDRILGTPAYMSPEQARGQRDLDGRSDIYALGAIVFQMLTGRLPYEADTPMALAIKHLTEPTPRILEARPDLPPACEDVIQKAMAKDRTQRFSSANGLAEALATTAISRPPASVSAAQLPTERLRPTLRLGRRVWIAAAAGALAILTLGAVLWLGRGHERGVVGGLAPTSIGIASTLVSTATPKVQTPSPAVPPTVTPTPTARPTAIPTRAPSWVTDFAEPILAAIAGREPDFQDDFSTKAGGWVLRDNCYAWRAKYENGVLLLSSCYVKRERTWYDDFVAEVEGRFVSVASQEASWSISFGQSGYGWDSVGITYGGGIWDCPATRQRARSGAQSNRLVLIGKGPQIAAYINGVPVCFKEREVRRGYLMLQSRITGYGEDNVVAFDNLKVWDITDLDPEASPAP